MTKIQRVELTEVIKVTMAVGEGTKEDPVREEIQYWEKNGKKIAEKSDLRSN